MSKKTNKNQPEKKYSEIVDQQKDPMLRALQKKTRNINKKLTEISQLSLRKDLKPEQEQKISKKPQLLQQREKYQEMVSIYQQIATQNQKIIRKAQLLQLEDLAAVLSFKQFGVDLGFLLNQNVDNLVRILITPSSNELNLQDRIKQITNALNDSASNFKLKKSVKQFLQKNKDYRNLKVNNECLSNEPEPISPRSEKEREDELKELQQEEKKHEIQNNQPLTPQLPQVAPHEFNQKLKVSESEAPNNYRSQNNKSQTKDLPKVQQTDEKNGNQQNQQNKKQNRPRGQQERGGRGQKRQKNDQRDYDQRRYKKRTFKPKYEEKERQEAKKDDDDSSSSISSQPKARQFKRQEVRELIQDGFIVVGKPKIKAREQKQYHDHEHGNKHHKHHSKKNY